MDASLRHAGDIGQAELWKKFNFIDWGTAG
jgi:hypothetical protein